MTADTRGVGARHRPISVSSHLGSRRGFGWTTVVALVLVVGASRSTFAQEPDQAVREQWFTGSLEAPSPALSKAGAFEMEPYGLINATTGAYDGRGINGRPPTRRPRPSR